MLDVVAFFVAWGLLTLAVRMLLRRVLTRPGLRWTAAFLLSFFVASVVVLQVSRSRSFQFFGHLLTADPRSQKVVALTFDDGPTVAAGPEILDLLRRENVKATFFLIGGDMAAAPTVVRNIGQAGHEIGNHSFAHKRMVFKSAAFIAGEIERTDQLIRRSGYAGPIQFRSPYGKRFISLPYYLARHGRWNVLFDVEPESDPDVDADSEKIVEHVLSRVRPGSIVLLHPWYRNRGQTRAALPKIITGLKARGYRFVTVSELMQVPKLEIEN